MVPAIIGLVGRSGGRRGRSRAAAASARDLGRVAAAEVADAARRTRPTRWRGSRRACRPCRRRGRGSVAAPASPADRRLHAAWRAIVNAAIPGRPSPRARSGPVGLGAAGQRGARAHGCGGARPASAAKSSDHRVGAEQEVEHEAEESGSAARPREIVGREAAGGEEAGQRLRLAGQPDQRVLADRDRPRSAVIPRARRSVKPFVNTIRPMVAARFSRPEITLQREIAACRVGCWLWTTWQPTGSCCAPSCPRPITTWLSPRTAPRRWRWRGASSPTW